VRSTTLLEPYFGGASQPYHAAGDGTLRTPHRDADMNDVGAHCPVWVVAVEQPATMVHVTVTARLVSATLLVMYVLFLAAMTFPGHHWANWVVYGFRGIRDGGAGARASISRRAQRSSSTWWRIRSVHSSEPSSLLRSPGS
jgi:hypothetical protein